jgi:hypothetical protein
MPKKNSTKKTAKPAPAAETAHESESNGAAPGASRAKARTAKKPAAAKKTAPATAAQKQPAFTNEDVALRAYFISEKRLRLGLPGDAHSDWIEAERQLQSESRAAKPKARRA